jgi:hypothetical protein
MNKFLLFLEKYLGAFLILVIGKTLRFRCFGNIPDKRVIYAFWHRNIIPLAYLHRKQGVAIMVSPSQDGEFIAGSVNLLGYRTPRGSSSRGSLAAMKKMLKLAKDHSLAITSDGPKGPAEKIKEGLLYLAYQSKLPIVPVAVDIKKEHVFNSWDKFRLPKLFTKINITYGDPIPIKTKEEVKTKLSVVQNKFKILEEKNRVR